MKMKNDTTKNGILCLNKDADMTSFLCCSVMRGLLGIKKIGHGGTLDPMATGVLPILCGSATKAMDILPIHDKRYLASFQLGKTSDTQDVWGTITENTTTFPSKEFVLKTIKQFVGDIQQIPPMMSALKKDGVRLYTLARQGIEIEREPRPVHIYSIDLIEYDQKTGCATIDCLVSKGTYIRSLCHDIGQSLGTGAIMTSLQRTMAAGYSIDQCFTLSQLREMDMEERYSHILPIDSAFSVYEKVDVSPAQGVRFSNGGSLFLDRLNTPVTGIVRVYAENEFLGLGSPQDDQMIPYKLFPSHN